MNDRVTNPAPDDSPPGVTFTRTSFDVWMARDGVEIVDGATDKVVLTIPHSQITDLIKQLVDAQGAALVASVRDAQADGSAPC